MLLYNIFVVAPFWWHDALPQFNAMEWCRYCQTPVGVHPFCPCFLCVAARCSVWFPQLAELLAGAEYAWYRAVYHECVISRLWLSRPCWTFGTLRPASSPLLCERRFVLSASYGRLFKESLSPRPELWWVRLGRGLYGAPRTPWPPHYPSFWDLPCTKSPAWQAEFRAQYLPAINGKFCHCGVPHHKEVGPASDFNADQPVASC